MVPMIHNLWMFCFALFLFKINLVRIDNDSLD